MAFPAATFGDEVLYERKGNVGIITLNAPKRMNTFSGPMVTGVQTALDMIAEDAEVHCVILTGAGQRAFCAGGNLGSMTDGASTGMLGKESDPIPPTQAAAVRKLRSGMFTSASLRGLNKPTIAVVNGACAGAGFSWACACDLRVCASTAVFKSAFASAGLSGDFGGTWTLPRIVGGAKARELYLLNRKVDAAEAQRIGLVSEVHPPEQLMAKALAMADAIAAGPPLVIGRIKQNLNQADASASFSEALDGEAERHARCAMHPDALEAGAAFMQKRTPDFSGVGAQEPWRFSKL
jgi:2-(1,2-epoxy-1,2-dihydrophenyl)acetyl-CoA isomerase